MPRGYARQNTLPVLHPGPLPRTAQLPSNAAGSSEHPRTGGAAALPVQLSAAPQASPSVSWPAVTLASAPTQLKNAKPETQGRRLRAGSPARAPASPPPPRHSRSPGPCRREGTGKGLRSCAHGLPSLAASAFPQGRGEGKAGLRLPPPPTNAPSTGVWEPAGWVLGGTALPAGSQQPLCPGRMQGGIPREVRLAALPFLKSLGFRAAAKRAGRGSEETAALRFSTHRSPVASSVQALNPRCNIAHCCAGA